MLVPKTHFAFFSFMLSLIKATFLDHPPECLLLLHSYADERAAGISGDRRASPHMGYGGRSLCLLKVELQRVLPCSGTSDFTIARVCVEVQLRVKPSAAGGTYVNGDTG